MFGGSGGKGIPAISRDRKKGGKGIPAISRDRKKGRKGIPAISRDRKKGRKGISYPRGRRFLEITEVERQNSSGARMGSCSYGRRGWEAVLTGGADGKPLLQLSKAWLVLEFHCHAQIRNKRQLIDGILIRVIPVIIEGQDVFAVVGVQ